MQFFDRQFPKFPLTAVADYRALARRRLPRQLFEFLEGGAFEETTLAANREDFQKILIKRRVMKDVSNVTLGIEIFEQELAFPLILAPVGFAGVYARRGEIQAIKAAREALIPFCLSAVGICSIEEVARHSPTPFWFQFYMLKDRGHALELLQRAQAHCPVLVLTVDLPMAGARHRYERSRRRSPGVRFWDALRSWHWGWDVWLRGRPLTIGNLPSQFPKMSSLAAMRQWISSQISQNFTWSDFAWVRQHWPGKIVIKGILDIEDAHLAKEVGADGIVVSNHGGRHLDGTTSTIAVLPKIRQIVGKDFLVLVDGGLQSGLDLFKALMLGADAGMIGKAWMWGLAVRGQQGVSEVIALFKQELKMVMTHVGVSSIKGITRT